MTEMSPPDIEQLPAWRLDGQECGERLTLDHRRVRKVRKKNPAVL